MSRRHPPPPTSLSDFFSELVNAATDAFTDAATNVLYNLSHDTPSKLHTEDPYPNLPHPRKRSRTVLRAKKAQSPSPQPKTRPRAPTKPPEPSFYDILEVSQACSPETLSAAFRSLSARFHPDNLKTGDQDRYKRITEAWNQLKDLKKRKQYDRSIGIR